MIAPARTIWDSRIQCVCGVVAAREGDETELYMCGNFGQVSLDPPRIVINPNRLYPIEAMLRRVRRFSLNVMAAGQRGQVLRLIRLRRREVRKPEVLGWPLDDHQGVPFLSGSIQTLFCELESELDTGDHTVMIARVLETRAGAADGQRPLLYGEIAGNPGRLRNLSRAVRRVLVALGLLDLLKRIVHRIRPPAPPNLPEATYRDGGQTESEIRQVLGYGRLDRSRILAPPRPAPRLRKPVGICVVGTHWGSFHCELVRKANPGARLFVCGQNRQRTERLARSVRAEDLFVGIESAAADPRVQMLSLALPHHLHRQAVETALSAGKHVLVEKPIATTLEDADAMIAAAGAAGRIFVVAEDMHFRPAVGLVAHRISRGDIGEPLQLLIRCGGVRRPEGWAADREKLGGGVFMDIGVHYVRALRLLMGEPDIVFTSRPMQLNTRMSGEDSLNVLFESRYGWCAHIFATWSAVFGPGPDMIVIGEKGTFHLWTGKRHVDFYPVAPRPLTHLFSYVRPYGLQAWLMRPGFQRIRIPLPGRETNGYVEEFRDFMAAIAENRPPASPPADGRRDLEIVLRAYESLEKAERVVIPAAVDLSAGIRTASAAPPHFARD